MRYEHVTEGFTMVHKVSILTGKESCMVLPLRSGQIEHWLDSGTLVQDAFPQLSDSAREFLISGITPEEWDATFGKGDE